MSLCKAFQFTRQEKPHALIMLLFFQPFNSKSVERGMRKREKKKRERERKREKERERERKREKERERERKRQREKKRKKEKERGRRGGTIEREGEGNLPTSILLGANPIFIKLSAISAVKNTSTSWN